LIHENHELFIVKESTLETFEFIILGENHLYFMRLSSAYMDDRLNESYSELKAPVYSELP